jgi:hypothetical protein
MAIRRVLVKADSFVGGMRFPAYGDATGSSSAGSGSLSESPED